LINKLSIEATEGTSLQVSWGEEQTLIIRPLEFKIGRSNTIENHKTIVDQKA